MLNESFALPVKNAEFIEFVLNDGYENCSEILKLPGFCAGASK